MLGDSAIDRVFTLGNAEYPVSWDNEVRLWAFLEDRASLLLKTYKTTSEVMRLHEDSSSVVLQGCLVRDSFLHVNYCSSFFYVTPLHLTNNPIEALLIGRSILYIIRYLSAISNPRYNRQKLSFVLSKLTIGSLA